MVPKSPSTFIWAFVLQCKNPCKFHIPHHNMCNYFNRNYDLITCHWVNWCTRNTCPCLSDNLCLQSVPCPGGLAYLTVTMCTWSSPRSFFQGLKPLGLGQFFTMGASLCPMFCTSPSSKVLLTPQVPSPLLPSSVLLLFSWHLSSLWNWIWTLATWPSAPWFSLFHGVRPKTEDFHTLVWPIRV